LVRRDEAEPDPRVGATGTGTVLLREARDGGWEILPADTNGQDDQFRDLGFEFGRVIADDRMYRQAKLPQGWMYDSARRMIVDEHGKHRVRIRATELPYEITASMDLVVD
jgi:hypothetical protein